MPTAVIHEPQADWVPLEAAPFYYSPSGYVRSADGWEQYIREKVEYFVGYYDGLRDRPEWSLSRPTCHASRSGHWLAAIEAMGMTTTISPPILSLCLGSFKDLPPDPNALRLSGRPKEFLNNPMWNNIPTEHRKAAEWHRSASQSIVSSCRWDLMEALQSGAGLIMARKNTILATFERVTWDQWQYFKLDEAKNPAGAREFWFDPRPFGSEARPLKTAIGPAGERLYAIHVAPGEARAAESDDRRPEEKCLQWVLELMRDFPERAPKSLGRLCEEAVSRFPGLSKRGFERCYFEAQLLTGNRNWSRAGAPPKSRR